MLRIISLIHILLLTSACGNSSGEGQAAGNTLQVDEPSESSEPSPEFEGRDSPRSNTYAVSTVALLPPCDFSSEGFIAYIEDSKKLTACIKQSDGSYSWRELDYATRDELAGFVKKDELPYNRARELYNAYRKSVYRIGVACTGPGGGASWGTAYKCGEGLICTNAHVVVCPSNSTFSGIILYRVGDRLDSTGEHFYLGSATVSLPNTSFIDLAKLTIPANLISADKTFENSATYEVATLSDVLSLSFPLGLRDMHTDLGYVKVNTVGECQGYWGGFCLSDYYDFYTSNDTDRGSSGSPLIDVSTGKVIGVTSAGLPGDILMNPNIATSASWFTIQAFWP